MLAPLFILMLGAAPPPPAAPPPAPAPAAADPNESAVVQELVEVVARYPGPALWTVHRGAGEVVVMGGYRPLPHMLEWNSHRLERAIDGAQVVLLPPTGRLGPLDLVYILFHAGDLALPGKQKLWDRLTPEERARFDDLSRQAKTDEKRYEKLKPAIAAMILDADFDKAAGLASAKPGSTVKELADKYRVPTRAEGGIPVGDVFRAVTKMDDAADRVCFDALLSTIERDAQRGRPLAEAWAKGDVRTLKAEMLAGDPIYRCIAGSGLQGFYEKEIRDATASIQRALDKGGKTVAVVDMSLLIRANGVLDRLRAEGATVDVPRD
jgi:hypothetical protein